MRTTINGVMREGAKEVSEEIIRVAEGYVRRSYVHNDDKFLGKAKVKRDRFVRAAVDYKGYYTNRNGQNVPAPILFWVGETGRRPPLRGHRRRNPSGYAYYRARDEVWRGKGGQIYREKCWALLKEARLV